MEVKKPDGNWGFRLYLAQCEFAENLLDEEYELRHQVKCLDDEEYSDFEEYFGHDWKTLDDLRGYYYEVVSENMELKIKANRALNKILDKFYRYSHHMGVRDPEID